MPDESPLIDRLVDATHRFGERQLAATPPLTVTHAPMTRLPGPKRQAKLDRLGPRHPVLGGALMGALVVVSFFPVFSIPFLILAAVGMLNATGFVLLEGFVALVCVVMGIWMAIVCGRVWCQREAP